MTDRKWLIVVIVVALVITFAGAFLFGRQEYDIQRTARSIEATNARLEDLDSQSRAIEIQAAWNKGYMVCENDVFRSWLDRATPQPMPRAFPGTSDGQ